MSERVDALSRSFGQTIAGIDLLLGSQLIHPCLVLLYSTIDAAAALERDHPDSDVTGRQFIAWADRYLIQRGFVSCSAVDLYAARCGVLHTFSAASRRSRGGTAERIAYAWGTGQA